MLRWRTVGIKGTKQLTLLKVFWIGGLGRLKLTTVLGLLKQFTVLPQTPRLILKFGGEVALTMVLEAELGELGINSSYLKRSKTLDIRRLEAMW
jgi:hypothetical protein